MASPTSHAEDRPRTLTLEEWAALPEDDAGELVDGHLAEEEVPDFIHELIVAWFTRALGNWIAPRGGFVGGSEAKLAIREGRGRKPDALVYFPGRMPAPRGVIRTPPDIALEVVTPTPRDGRRDRVEKLADYALMGVRQYWLLDPELRTLEMLALTADGLYAHALSATGGVVTSVPGCEGLTLDLDDLWREVGRLLAGGDRTR